MLERRSARYRRNTVRARRRRTSNFSKAEREKTTFKCIVTQVQSRAGSAPPCRTLQRFFFLTSTILHDIASLIKALTEYLVHSLELEKKPTEVRLPSLDIWSNNIALISRATFRSGWHLNPTGFTQVIRFKKAQCVKFQGSIAIILNQPRSGFSWGFMMV